MLSSLALTINGLVCGAFGVALCFYPNVLLQAFGRDLGKWEATDVGSMLLQMMRYIGAAEFVFAFLFLHYISFPDKQQAGLRLAVMLRGVYAAVAGYRMIEAGVSSKSKDSATKNLGISVVMLAISVVGMLAAPKPPKTKSN